MGQVMDERELLIGRIIAAPADKLFRCWTEAELLKQWFCPEPWRVSHAELDVRPGGSSLVVMLSPQGQEFPNRGVYLEVEKNRKIVLTDAYTEAWQASEKPFMTSIITFDDMRDGSTRYTARVLHWSKADRKAHEEMGFHEGWGKATEQLAKLAAGL